MPETDEPLPNRLLTPEEHKQRHLVLHRAFDELIADYLFHHRGKLLADSSLLDLIVWSSRQTIEPEEIPQ